ncbi:MAG: hypothetical protein H0U75_09840 [Legionella sp.]|nr:hypothetical protein [Legionella sp.]
MHQVPIINIPAYDASGKGLVIEFKLTIIPDNGFLVSATGKIAAALQNNFNRIIEIMVSIKKSWECLGSIAYMLESDEGQFSVKDSKSSSMALSIALINAHRVLQGQLPISGLTGTGILRIDGSFEHSHLEDKKYLAAKQSIPSLKKFITPNECNHLYDLEQLINQF